MKNLLLTVAIAIFSLSAVCAQSNTKAALRVEDKAERKEAHAYRKGIRVARHNLRRLNEEKVSYQAQQAFQTGFPMAQSPVWQRLENYDEVSFRTNAGNMSAFYDGDAKLVGTTTVKGFADLPAKAQRTLKSDYNGYQIEDVLFYDDNEANETDMILYGEQFQDQDSFFVEMKKDNHKIVVQVLPSGQVTFFISLT